jgi:ligand-binding sensor domain-containing protein
MPQKHTHVAKTLTHVRLKQMMTKQTFLKIIATFLCLSAVFNLPAQPIPVGSWRVHLPYSRAISVAASRDEVYCMTANSLFRYNKRDFSTVPLSKNTGLSDAGYSVVAYHQPTKTFIVAYNNANLDLIRDNEVYNMPDIKRQLLPIDKTIHKITFRGDDAWLSCGFGIVVLNMKKREFRQTCQIGPGGSYIDIFDIKFFKDSVYAATKTGIYRASMSDYLPDFNNWKKWMDVPYPDTACNTLDFFNGMPFIHFMSETGLKDTIFYRENDIWKVFQSDQKRDCFQLDVIGDKFLMAMEDYFEVIDDQMKEYRIIYDYGLGQPIQMPVYPSFGTMDDEGFLWIADKNVGLAFIYDQWSYGLICPNGPRNIFSFQMDASSDQIWVATGAYSSTWTMAFQREGLYHYNGTEWKTTDYHNDPILDTVFDFVCVAIDPSDPSKVFAGSWGQGLVLLKDGKTSKIYDETNSTLQSVANSASPYFRVPVGGLTFDSKGNLWISNPYTAKSLSLFKKDGSWYAYDISSADNSMEDKASGKIVIDRIGQKWVLVGRGNGIQVFSDNDTYAITADDNSANISGTPGKGALPSNLVTDMALDLDGRLWIGTDKGLVVIYSPENVFSGYSYDAQRILVNQDGYNQYLLENETVTAIAVDGANRKWIGTEKSGVFLLSADCTREIARFNEDNSPLLSNGIRSIAIDGRSGEVFFGTDKGIISYRSDAMIAGETATEVTVFPNPVQPGYSGLITITGLVRDSDVKIRNMGGDVVFSTLSNGGEAVWNGKDLSGKTVATGVYMIFASEANGVEKAVGKIVFIR